MRALAFAAVLTALAAPAFAVGPDDTPPTPTETTTTCEDGKVWDEASEACVAPTDVRLDDETRYKAARELAYAGQYGAAEAVLDAMDDQRADGVLTYRGFIARKNGDWAEAKARYSEALAENPDNFLARSYLGLGLLDRGDRVAATAQLSAIRARGGRNTWAEAALALALAGGDVSGY